MEHTYQQDFCPLGWLNGGCPEVTPTVTPTPTQKPCREDCVTPTVTPTPTAIPSATPTVTPTTEPTPTPFAGFQMGGAPTWDCTYPTWAPALTFNGKEFTWTTIDNLNEYFFKYGQTKDNLNYAVIVHGNSFMPQVNWSGQVWASVAATNNGCLSPFSLVVDPSAKASFE